MRYMYKVIKSKSPEMPVGEKRVLFEKIHDGRRKDKCVELSDVNCRDYTLKCIKEMSDEEWEAFKREVA